MKVKTVVSLIRPQQWAKNVFIALPLFFNGSLLDIWCWKQTLIAIIAFSLISSAVYCLNDIVDVASDRRHPKKKHRPVAAGEISISSAYAIMTVLAIGSLASCFLLQSNRTAGLVCIIASYFILNVSYCLKLKQYALIDVFIIATGFVLRLCAGGTVCQIWLSPWIVSMTFLLALFLAFAKRRDDVVIRETTGSVTRSNTVRYNLEFLNQTLGIIGTVTIVCYIIYAVTPEVEMRMNSNYVYVTSVFVLAGILRYLQVAIVDMRSGSPTKILFHDRFIQTCIIFWVVSFIIIIYF